MPLRHTRIALGITGLVAVVGAGADDVRAQSAAVSPASERVPSAPAAGANRAMISPLSAEPLMVTNAGNEQAPSNAMVVPVDDSKLQALRALRAPQSRQAMSRPPFNAEPLAPDARSRVTASSAPEARLRIDPQAEALHARAIPNTRVPVRTLDASPQPLFNRHEGGPR